MLFGGFGFPGPFGPTVSASSNAAVPAAFNLASPFPTGAGFGPAGLLGGIAPWGGFPPVAGGFPTTFLNNRFSSFPETFANVTPFGFGFPGI